LLRASFWVFGRKIATNYFMYDRNIQSHPVRVDYDDKHYSIFKTKCINNYLQIN